MQNRHLTKTLSDSILEYVTYKHDILMINIIYTIFFISSIWIYYNSSAHEDVFFPKVADHDQNMRIKYGWQTGYHLCFGGMAGFSFLLGIFGIFAPTPYKLKIVFWLTLPIGIDYILALLFCIYRNIKATLFDIAYVIFYIFFIIYYICS